jgi:hypothetical protein
MMMPTIIMAVMMPISAVSPAFRLERGLHPCEVCSKAKEHVLDHMIGPNAKNMVSNFGRQMAISEMPGEAHELVGICMFNFDDKLRGGFDLQQPPIFKLQGISIGHGNRSRKIEKEIFALVRSQANAAAMTGIEIESDSAGRALLWPMARRTMNCSVMHRRLNT